MIPYRELGGRLVRRFIGIRENGMPRSTLASSAFIASHIARKVVQRTLRREGTVTDNARTLLADTLFLGLSLKNLGANSMIRGGHGFFPHIFMPSYHGPHFEEALVRIAFPRRGPNILYFSLTGDCPCKCEYCFAGAGPDASSNSGDIGDDKAIEVARQVAALGVPLVNISGGEPLTRYPRLLDVIRELSVGCEVRMFTSGIGLTPERLVELRAAGLTGIFVSLDTDNREEYDRSRGLEGAFDAAVRALSFCSESGMLTFINCVVGRDRFENRGQVEHFLRFVDEIDPRIVVNFLPQLATGRGAQADSFRFPCECEEVADLIVETARDLGRPVSMLFGRVDRFVGCPGAGGKLMNVDIWGNVTVCISQATLGNVLEEPFTDIYERFVQNCRRLKIGFFCAEVSDNAGDELLPKERSQAALVDFYQRHADSDWQQHLDRYGWILQRLVKD